MARRGAAARLGSQAENVGASFRRRWGVVFKSARCISVLRCPLMLGVAVLCGERSASAQTDQSIETVVVTGSRLPQQNMYSSRPLTAISPQEFKFEGTTDVTTLLNNLPESFADQSSTVSNGARGIA